MKNNLISSFRPQFLKNWAVSLGFTETDFSVYERPAHSGRPTYALGMDLCRTRFPEWIISDTPMWCLKKFFVNVLAGFQEARRRNPNFSFRAEGEMDLERGVWVGGRDPIQTIRRLAEMGNLLSGGYLGGEILWSADQSLEEIARHNDELRERQMRQHLNFLDLM